MDNIGNTEHALTFADLRVHYYTGRSYLISGEGRDKVFGYRHGVMTDIGDLPEAEWTRLAKQLIRQSGEQELYQQLFAWEREQSHWEQSGCAEFAYGAAAGQSGVVRFYSIQPEIST